MKIIKKINTNKNQSQYNYLVTLQFIPLPSYLQIAYIISNKCQ